MDNKSLTRRSTLCALGGVVGSALVTGTVVGQEESEASITFNDQQSDGKSVVVESVTLPEPGFIDFHDPSRAGGDHPTLGSGLGGSEYLEPGTHEDLEITLFQGLPCVTFEQNRLQESKEVMAMPHVDSNDTKKFEHWCTMQDEEKEIVDGGFGEFPDNIVQDTACIQVDEDTASGTLPSNPSFFGVRHRLEMIL